MNLHFGIDLGGTKIELVAIDNKFNILYKERILTESEKGSDHVLNQIDVLYKKANKFFGFREHTVGIGTPGSISQETGLLRNSTIYCHNGLTVSPLIVALFMIKYGNVSLDSIRDILRSKNKNICLDYDLSVFNS